MKESDVKKLLKRIDDNFTYKEDVSSKILLDIKKEVGKQGDKIGSIAISMAELTTVVKTQNGRVTKLEKWRDIIMYSFIAFVLSLVSALTAYIFSDINDKIGYNATKIETGIAHYEDI